MCIDKFTLANDNLILLHHTVGERNCVEGFVGLCFSQLSIIENILSQTVFEQVADEFHIHRCVSGLQQVFHGFRCGSHRVEVAIMQGTHHLCANQADFSSRHQVFNILVVGDNALVFNRIVNYQKKIQRVFAIKMAIGIPRLLKCRRHRVECGKRLRLIKNKHRLYLLRDCFIFSPKRLIVLVYREVERRVKCFMLPRFRKLVLILELTRARQLPKHQKSRHYKNRHLRNGVVVMAYVVP